MMNAKIHVTFNKYLFTHIYNKIRVSPAPSNQRRNFTSKK